MALASLPLSGTAPFVGLARGVETTATTTVLVLDDGRRRAVAVLPDPAGARRCLRSLNRVVSVAIDGSDDRLSARVRGVGNRLPVELAIPVAAALGLVASGVPALIRLSDGAPA